MRHSPEYTKLCFALYAVALACVILYHLVKWLVS